MRTQSIHKIPFILLSATVSLLPFVSIPTQLNASIARQSEVAGLQLDELRECGYRIDWMNQSNANGLKLPTIIADSLYAVDSDDHLTRYDLQSGKWLWSAPVGNKIYEIQSIMEFPKDTRIYILSDGAVYILEKSTGNYPSRSNSGGKESSGEKRVLPLRWTANTPAITLDDKLLIYGSTKGDVVWFNPSIGFDSHRYRIGSSINVMPSLVSGVRNQNGDERQAIVTTSNDGDIVAIDLNQLTELWTLSLTSQVVTPIVSGTHFAKLNDESLQRTSVFIAGTDQYLRAIDLHSGKQRWNVLTSSKLTDAPFYLDSRVYQRIPDVGLAAFNAFPDHLSGEQIWISDDVLGTVITTKKNGQLVCWDENKSLLQVVDPRKGGLVSTLTIPNVKNLITDSKTNGSLYLLTHDDEFIRLVPRH